MGSKSQLILSANAVSFGVNNSDYLLLDNISFNVEKGDFLGIIGASGAGKTTLLRLLNRLIDPYQGQILFNNKNVKNIPILNLRGQIVLVPQEAKLLGMSVQETLTYPLKLLKLNPNEIVTRLDYCVSELNLPPEWLDRQEIELSVGQKQLVAIARGLIMKPQILLLDEPTSALDKGKANFLMEILKKLTEQKNLSIVMVSHQLELIEKYANKIIFLEKGKIIETNLVKNINWSKINEQLKEWELKEKLEEF